MATRLCQYFDFLVFVENRKIRKMFKNTENHTFKSLNKVKKRKKEKSVRVFVVWSMLRYIASSKINSKPLTDTKYDFSIIVEKMEN